MSALLPCPFCGHVGLDFSEGSTFRWRIAECIGCGATTGEERIQTVGDGTTEEWEANCRERLIAAWNHRAAQFQKTALTHINGAIELLDLAETWPLSESGKERAKAHVAGLRELIAKEQA